MLLSKFFLPELRPNRVDRPHLLERLRQATKCQLVVISAPAGYGKTTLASEWVRAEGCPTAWISLDDSDNDLVRFWAGLISAIDQLYPGTGKNSQSLLAIGQPVPPQVLLTTLLNDLILTTESKTYLQPACLVLDDTHLVNNAVIYECLLYFVEHLTRNLRLVLIGRSDPPLPLGRLRASCRVLEIRAADLRFSLAESQDFLNRVMGLPLSQDRVKRLEARTEGWIAGLQLASLAMQGWIQDQGSEEIDAFIEAFSGDDRYILDYLVEEVLSRLPEETQTFLLQTSILDRMCGPLCDAVTGLPAGKSQALLEQSERENLFLIPLDTHRQWYRYHHLFSDLLRNRSERLDGRKAKEAVEALHHRAAVWFGSHGYNDSAICHALASGDLEMAAQLIQQSGETAWFKGEFTTLLRQLFAVPQEIRVAEPRLGILLGWCVTLSGQLDSLAAAEAELDVIEARLRPASELPVDSSPDAETFGMLCTVRGVMASVFHNDDKAALEWAQLALRCLPETNLVWRGAATLSIGHAYNARGDVPRSLAMYTEAISLNQAAGNPHLALRSAIYRIMQLYFAGQMTRAIQEIQDLLPATNLLSEAGQPTFVGAHFTSCLIRYEWNQLTLAREDVEQVIRLGERWNNQGVIILGLIYQVFIDLALEDVQGVETALDAARRLVHENEQSARMYAKDIDALQALVWLKRDQIELACSWAGRQAFPEEPAPSRNIHSAVLARVLIRSGQADQALRYLLKARCVLEAHGQITALMEILVLQALALYELGQFETAIQPLQLALEKGEGEGFLRIFLNEGQPLAELLKVAQPRLPECQQEYTKKLIFAFHATMRASQPAASPTLIEPLTAREIEVLRLIQAGLSNREIADKLYLTLNTVKVHVKNIFAKLDVESRTQAVRRTEELGLI